MLAVLALLVNLLTRQLVNSSTRQLVNFILPTSYLILLIPLACLHQLYYLYHLFNSSLTRQLVNPSTALSALLHINMTPNSKMRFILRIEIKRAAHGSAIIEPQLD
jgi:hypothetical protein